MSTTNFKMNHNFIIRFYLISSILCESLELQPFMLKLHALECNTDAAPICLNGGICFDWSKIGGVSIRNDVNLMGCYCQQRFYGPHCEFAINSTILNEPRKMVRVRSKRRVSRRFKKAK